MKNLLILLPVVLLAFGCKSEAEKAETKKLNHLATEYVRLGLTIGQYDTDFVDAYYGPDSLKPTTSAAKEFPKDSLLASINELMNDIKPIACASEVDSNRIRASWMYDQLVAFGRRIRIYTDEEEPFDDESKALLVLWPPYTTRIILKLLLITWIVCCPARAM